MIYGFTYDLSIDYINIPIEDPKQVEQLTSEFLQQSERGWDPYGFVFFLEKRGIRAHVIEPEYEIAVELI